MKRLLLFFALMLMVFTMPAMAGTYFWVGNGGNWADFNQHWATSTGGSIMHTSAPGPNDTVYFDQNSFTQSGQSVIINTLLAECGQFVWSDTDHKTYLFSGVNDTLRVHGSCLMSDSLVFNFSGHLDIVAAAPVIAFLQFGTRTLQCNLRLAADSAVLLSRLNLSNNSLYIRQGSLFTNGFNVSCKHFNTDSTLQASIMVGQADWYSSDTLFVRGSMALAPTLGFHQIGPVCCNFYSIDKNYINPYSNSFPGKLILQGSKKMYVLNPLHIAGNLEFTGGGSLYTNGKTITAARLISNSALARTLHFSSSVIHLTAADSTLKLQSNGLTLIADTADVYFDYAGIDTVSIASGKDAIARFRRIYLPSTYVLLYHPLRTSLLHLGNGSNLAIARGTTLTADNIQSSSDCQTYNYLRAFCSSCPDCGDGAICDTLRPVLITTLSNTLNFLKIRNLRHTGAALTANNSYNEGNVSGITINEPLTADTLYWVQGSGKWNDPGHWAQTSGGAPNSSCLPNRYTNVVFDNASFPANATVSIPENAYCHDISWTHTTHMGLVDGSGHLVITGDIALNEHVRFIQAGGLLLQSSASDTNTINAPRADLNCAILIDGSNSWLLTDTLNLKGRLTLRAGKLLLNNNNLRCNAFITDGTLPRTLDYSYSTLVLNGSDTTWRASGSNLTITDTAAAIRIVGSGSKLCLMDAGNQVFDTLDIRAASVRIANGISACSLLKVAPGTTVEFEPLRTINFDSLVASGNCQQRISLSGYSGSIDTAVFRCSTDKDSIVISNVILRNLCADTSGKRKYTAATSNALGKTTGWIITPEGAGKKFYWTGLVSSDWHQAGNWEYDSIPATCLPGPQDTVFFEKSRLAAPGCYDSVIISKSAYCRAMLWQDSIAGSPKLRLEGTLFCSGSVQLCESLSLLHSKNYPAAHENAPKLIFQHNSTNATLNPLCKVFEVNLSVQAANLTDTLKLTGDLNTGWQNKVSILSGTFISGENNINTGIFETSGERQKNINLANSKINITYAFLMQPPGLLRLSMDSSELVLNDSSFLHSIFDGGGHRYHSVEFQSRHKRQSQVNAYADILSSDTVHFLKFNPGLHVRLTAGITQVFDSLVINGACTDSLSLETTAPGSPASLRDMNGDTINGLCLNVKDISAFPTALAIYSTNQGGNSNWTFSNLKLTNAGFSYETPNCFGDSIHFQNTTTALSADITDLAFMWVFGDNDTTYNYEPIHLYSGNDEYYLSLTSTDTATGCVDIFRDTITVRKPDIQLTVAFADGISDYQICRGDSITLTALSDNLNPSFAYVFGNDTLPSVTDTFLITNQITNGEEIFVIVDDFGCKANSNNFVITVDELPVVNLSCGDPDTAVCSGEIITLSASGANQYELYLNGGIADSLSGTNHWDIAAPADQDQYTLFGRNSLTGCRNFSTDTLTITVHPTPLINFSSSEADHSLCYGDAVTMNASGALYYQYLLNGTPLGDTTYLSSITSSAIEDGDIFSVTGTSLEGCSATSGDISYQVHPTPNVVLTTSEPDGIICHGQSVTFMALGAVSYQFFIDGDSVAATNPGEFVSSGFENGQTISVSGTLGDCSAPGDTTYTIDVRPNISWTYSNPVICANDTVHFTAHGDSQYLFSINGSPQGSPGPDSVFHATGLTNGQVISVSGTAGACTPSGLSVVVHPLPLPVFTCSDPDTSICEGDMVSFTASGADMYAYFLNGVQLTPFSGITIYNTDSLNNGDVVTLEAQTTFGCSRQSSNNFTLEVRPYPIPTLSCSDADLTLCAGDSIQFIAQGADLYEFFVTGASQGPASNDSVFTSNGLTTGAVITMAGTTGQCTALSGSSYPITVHPLPIVDFIPLSPLSYCTGDTLELMVSGATSYEFFVDGISTGPASGNNIFSSANLSDGQIISVNAYKNNCVSTADTAYTVDVNDYPSLSFTHNLSGNSLCYGDTVEFAGEGASGYIFYLDGIPVSYDSVFSTSNLEPGQSVALYGGNGACWLNADTIFQLPVNQMDLQLTCNEPSASVCAGDQVTFAASGADLYEFYVDGLLQGPPSTSGTFMSSGLSNGQTISVTGTSLATACAQTSNASWVVHVYEVPQIDADPATPVCEGDSVLVQCTTGGSLAWYLNNTLVPELTGSQFYTTDAGAWTVLASHLGENICLSAGENSAGQLGNNSLSNSLNFREADLLTSVSEVACGDEFTIARRSNGELYAWGRNEFGALGNGNFTDALVPVGVGGISDALRMGAGARHGLALLSNGTLRAWGDNTFGQLGLGNFFTTNFPMPIPGLSDIIDVAAGDEFSLAVTATGDVYAWGRNQYGQLGDGTQTNSSTPVLVSGLHNVVAVRAGGNHALALKADGSLWVWGANNAGQLGTGDIVGQNVPVKVPLPIGVVSFDGGLEHSIATDSAGHVYCWGGNTFGQIGDSSTLTRLYPVRINRAGHAEKVVAGQYASYALRNDMNVFSWGKNMEGQLGLGHTDPVYTPALALGIAGISSMDAGLAHIAVVPTVLHQCESAPLSVQFIEVPDVAIALTGLTLYTTLSGQNFQWYYNGNPIPAANDSTLLLSAHGIYQLEVTFSNGCSALSNPFDYFSGVDENASGFECLIFPNPNNGYFTILTDIAENSDNSADVSLRNVTGQIIYAQRHTIEGGQIHIMLSAVAPGMYVLEIRNEKGVYRNPIIIK